MKELQTCQLRTAPFIEEKLRTRKTLRRVLACVRGDAATVWPFFTEPHFGFCESEVLHRYPELLRTNFFIDTGNPNRVDHGVLRKKGRWYLICCFGRGCCPRCYGFFRRKLPTGLYVKTIDTPKFATECLCRVLRNGEAPNTLFESAEGVAAVIILFSIEPKDEMIPPGAGNLGGYFGVSLGYFFFGKASNLYFRFDIDVPVIFATRLQYTAEQLEFLYASKAIWIAIDRPRPFDDLIDNCMSPMRRYSKAETVSDKATSMLSQIPI
ncbi:hypothetical protein JJB09_26025 [Rhizobium sp. KVB221]|uniref:Uncharacterized protein n=1 Tax=Rhizobium setariae TaxID=2801340 RepID=A0A936YV44_9HYPH|nr:hypothetical protein [Rhizobium setariae]MBL0375469.1 hypothetical protein [Rhizobium setariae]